MLARLWWKEARLFWPLWLFVALGSLGAQALILYFVPNVAKAGLLPAMALAWACLYACAVGSAAFAGEREVKALTFLDTLPVGRGTLWGGKFVFAMASSLALAAVVVAAAAPATSRWNVGSASPWLVGVGFASVLAEVVGWGLVWSSLTRTALTAAVLAVCCEAVSLPVVNRLALLDYVTPLPVEPETEPERLLAASIPLSALVGPIPVRFAVAAVTSLLSAGLITARPRRPFLRRAKKTKSRRAGALFRPVALPRVEIRPAIPSWIPAARRLAWQARRELGWGWLGMAALGVGIPWWAGWSGGMQEFFLFNTLVALWAGVKVFGSESRAGGQRFLTHHGAGPGLVWLSKVGVTLLALPWITLPCVLAAAWVAHYAWFGGRDLTFATPWEQNVLVGLTALADAFAIALLCGMAIKRGITAAVASAALLVAAVPPQVGLLQSGMIAPAFLAGLPLVLLFASRAWSRDWLFEPAGARRWVRLGLLVVVPIAALAAGYVADRAWGLPASTGAAGLAFSRPAASGDALALYVEADRTLTSNPQLDPSDPAFAKALALVHEASQKPSSALLRPGSTGDVPERRLLGEHLAADVKRTTERGDLDRAWAELADLFRMAVQSSGPVPLAVLKQGLDLDRVAVDGTVAWASSKAQTPERLRKALDELKALRWTRDSLAESIAFEADGIEQTLGRPADEIRDAYLAHTSDPGLAVLPYASALAVVTTTPWEVERARRAFGLLFDSAIDEARREPTQRGVPLWDEAFEVSLRSFQHGPHPNPRFFEYLNAARSTPLVRPWLPNLYSAIDQFDHAETSRRALEQILAIRLWQLTHDGKSPESLSDVAPLIPGGLPNDPYGGRSFYYVAAEGPALWGARWVMSQDPNDQRPVGGRVLYSVGRDRRDDHGVPEGHAPNGGGDVVLPVPRGPNDPLPDLPPDTFAPGPTSEEPPLLPADGGSGEMMGGGTPFPQALLPDGTILALPPALPIMSPPTAPR